jgi:hypothetical protein
VAPDAKGTEKSQEKQIAMCWTEGLSADISKHTRKLSDGAAVKNKFGARAQGRTASSRVFFSAGRPVQVPSQMR